MLHRDLEPAKDAGDVLGLDYTVSIKRMDRESYCK